MADTKALVVFDEKRYEVYFLDFRVFIQGVEVTQWINSAVTITKTNRDGAGTASFTLDNAMDRFVLTEDNLQGTEQYPNGKWRDTNDKYSEASKHSLYLYKTGAQEVTQDRINEMVRSLFDRNLELAKVKSRQQLLQELGITKRIARGVSLEDLAVSVASANTADLLPGDILLDDKDRVKTALAKKLVENKMTASEADFNAHLDTKRARLDIIRANRVKSKKRGKKGARRVEIDPDGSAVELGGRHKRKKTLRNPVDSDTGDQRWPLQDRSAIFHKNDPVRIFVHNPLSEGRGSATESKGFWLYGFTGFVDSYPINTDYLTGHSNIQIQCYDIRSLMQKMRVSQNPVLLTVAPEPMFTDRSSVFADLLVPSRWGQAFANLKFEDAMATLLTGTNLERRGQGRKFGIGNMEIGKIIEYPAKNGTAVEDGDKVGADSANRDVLEAWHTLCINGPGPLSNDDEIARTKHLTDQDVEIIGRGSTTDGTNSPLNALVHFLLPKAGTAARTLTQIQFDAGTEQRDWVSRFEIITDYCARLDYEMTVIGNGDIVFEFPMYDFLPSDFGDWKGVFEADHHLIDGEISDESGDIITALIVTGGPQNADIDSKSNAPASQIPRGLIQSSVMAARVGVTVDNHSMPFIRSGQRLRSLGLIEFQKRMSNANQFSMNFGYRPFITPNRPVLNAYEKRMGLTSSITDTLTVFGTASTSASIRFVRQVRADGSFRFISGGKSMPLSYRDVFSSKRKSPGSGKHGIRTSPEYDGDPSALEDNTTAAEGAKTVPGNEDRPPHFVQERRPGTYFTMSPAARRIAEIIAQTIDDRFMLNNIPVADGNTFSIRARDVDGKRVFSNKDRQKIAQTAKDNGYLLVDTRQRFVFEPRRSGQPDFIERPDG